MNKKLRFFKMLIVMSTGCLIGWSIVIGNAIIPIPAAIGGSVLLYLLRKRVKEVIEDERIHKINEKASTVTLQVFGIVIALLGAILIALSQGGLSDFRQAGFTLSYSACFLILIYSILYSYYARKY